MVQWQVATENIAKNSIKVLVLNLKKRKGKQQNVSVISHFINKRLIKFVYSVNSPNSGWLQAPSLCSYPNLKLLGLMVNLSIEYEDNMFEGT